jgi:hypothetical protein
MPAGEQVLLLSFMGYFWWMALGGMGEILLGGIYFGTEQQSHLTLLNAAEYQLFYVVMGIFMLEMGLGILRLERWVYWAAWPFAFVIGGVAVDEIVKWASGGHFTLETIIFVFMNLFFALYGIYFALQPGVRREFRYTPFQRGSFSPPLVLFVVVLALPALAVNLEVHYVDKHLSTPALALAYLLTFALMIVMAYGALRLQAWTWVVAWAWAAVVVALCVDVIVRWETDGNISDEGLIASIVVILFVASAVYYLLRSDTRRAFFHAHAKKAMFSPPMLIGGLLLAVFAAGAYLLQDDFGTAAIAYTVLGLAVGVIVGMLPDADPVARLMGFMLGALLAFASYVVRGGFLPYTKLWSAVVVVLLLAIITGITALFRSSTWFVSMLLGAGILYGAVELQFQLAPSAYLASAGVAFVSILFSFGLGYMVSVLLGLKPVAPSRADVAPSDAAFTAQPAGPAGATQAAGHASAMPAGAAGGTAAGAASGTPAGAAGTATEAGTGKHAGGTHKDPKEPGPDGAGRGASEGGKA